MTCIIIPFPAAKRIGKIRHTAQLLSERSGKGAEHYWRQVIGGMRSQMVTAQLDPDVIDAELLAFADQVIGTIHEMGCDRRA
ncbi:DUF6074 family protein [Mesorhizobium sp. A556]